MVFNSNTRDLWVINKVHNNQDKVILKSKAADIDNHAGIYCFCKIISQIPLMSEECTIYPLLTK